MHGLWDYSILSGGASYVVAGEAPIKLSKSVSKLKTHNTCTLPLLHMSNA